MSQKSYFCAFFFVARDGDLLRTLFLQVLRYLSNGSSQSGIEYPDSSVEEPEHLVLNTNLDRISAASLPFISGFNLLSVRICSVQIYGLVLIC